MLVPKKFSCFYRQIRAHDGPPEESIARVLDLALETLATTSRRHYPPGMSLSQASTFLEAERSVSAKIARGS